MPPIEFDGNKVFLRDDRITARLRGTYTELEDSDQGYVRIDLPLMAEGNLLRQTKENDIGAYIFKQVIGAVKFISKIVNPGKELVLGDSIKISLSKKLSGVLPQYFTVGDFIDWANGKAVLGIQNKQEIFIPENAVSTSVYVSDQDGIHPRFALELRNIINEQFKGAQVALVSPREAKALVNQFEEVAKLVCEYHDLVKVFAWGDNAVAALDKVVSLINPSGRIISIAHGFGSGKVLTIEEVKAAIKTGKIIEFPFLIGAERAADVLDVIINLKEWYSFQGIITEAGGALSHPAIVFRELFGDRGLPWISGVPFKAIAEMAGGEVELIAGETPDFKVIGASNMGGGSSSPIDRALADSLTMPKPKVVISFADYANFRNNLADLYGTASVQLEKEEYPDGEISVIVPDPNAVKGSQVCLISDISDNRAFVTFLLQIGSLMDFSRAKEIICLLPESSLKNKILLDAMATFIKIYTTDDAFFKGEQVDLSNIIFNLYKPYIAKKHTNAGKKLEYLLLTETSRLKEGIIRGLKGLNSDIGIGVIKVATLDDGGAYAQVPVEVKDKDCLLIHSTRSLKSLVELPIILEELKRHGAKDVHVLFFFFGYDRAERNFHKMKYGPKALSANSTKMILKLISETCRRIYTINAHFIKRPGTDAYHFSGATATIRPPAGARMRATRSATA